MGEAEQLLAAIQGRLDAIESKLDQLLARKELKDIVYRLEGDDMVQVSESEA